MTLRRRIGELLGYSITPHQGSHILLRPNGMPVFESMEWTNTEEEAWDFLPVFDGWEGVGLVIRWLMRDPSNAQGIASFLCANTDDFPRAICKFALEVSE